MGGIRALERREFFQLPTKLKPTVIVLDDDLSLRRALKTQLGAAGLTVLAFASSHKLLELEFSSDTCLLLNVYMPELDGVEICRVLLTSGREVPAVLISAYDEKSSSKVAGRSKVAGKHRYKRFDSGVLLSAIRKALRSKSKSCR